MNAQQELSVALKELELAKTNLKGPGSDSLSAQKRGQMESKLHWLESKVEKLRKKTQS